MEKKNLEPRFDQICADCAVILCRRRRLRRGLKTSPLDSCKLRKLIARLAHAQLDEITAVAVAADERQLI